MFDEDFDEKVRALAVEQEKTFFAGQRAWRAGDAALDEQHTRRLVEIHFEMRKYLRDAAAKLTALTKTNPNASESEQAAQLVRAFAIGARLLGLWDDAMGSPRIATRFERRICDIANTLGFMGKGHTCDLAIYLKDPSPDVRVAAATRLLHYMEDESVHVLRSLAQKNRKHAGRYARHWLPARCIRCQIAHD